MSFSARNLVLAALASFALAAPSRGGETFKTLKENIFVCVSPQVYDEAMQRVREAGSRGLEPLKKELSEAQQCMFVDAEMADAIMAPFAIVLQKEGSKVQVQFIVTFREKIAFLHRLTNRYVLVGWTEESNLTPKQIL